METLPKKAIFETIEASEEYSALLDSLICAATAAETQVTTSASVATQQVEAVFEELASTLTSYLNDRKLVLLESIQSYERESLAPLAQCKQEIVDRQNATCLLIEDAKKVLAIGGFKSQDVYSQFMSKSEALGTLPAVPDVELVPSITFQGCPDSVISDLKTSIMSFGSIYKIGPVQITSIEPHPGSLLVRWEEIDFDSQAEIQCYKLQIASFEAWSLNPNDESIFRDLYIGSELAFLTRDLRYKEQYSFRVCCRRGVDSPWSAWSRVKTSCTHVPPFTWGSANPSYLISNEGKLARMVSPGCILFSSAPHIAHGHSVQFTLLNLSDSTPDEGVALSSTHSLANNTLAQIGTLFVSFRGDIFIDGKKKIINLPLMSNRDKLIFGCEIVKGKWRITIESGSKAVTYDWDSGTDVLYFATLLCQSETQVLVE